MIFVKFYKHRAQIKIVISTCDDTLSLSVTLIIIEVNNFTVNNLSKKRIFSLILTYFTNFLTGNQHNKTLCSIFIFFMYYEFEVV